MANLLLYPMLILMIFTLISLIISLFVKVHAIRIGTLPLSAVNELEYSKAKSFSARITAYHFQDLCRTPFIFYFSVLIILYLKIDDPIFLILGWLYSAFMIFHSLIFLLYNRFILRLSLFLIANSFLTAMVILVLIEMIKLK